jgi:2-haloacid dehalogenase
LLRNADGLAHRVLELVDSAFRIADFRRVRAYHHFERELEADRPHRAYREVLSAALLRAAAEVGISISAALTLPKGWGLLPVFPDVETMLGTLRTKGCSLAVLTNCDNDLFAETERAFRQPFDLVITAEQVGAYKA